MLSPFVAAALPALSRSKPPATENAQLSGAAGTKPCVAGGAYIDRMSDYCADCAYRPTVRVGENVSGKFESAKIGF